MPPTTRFLHSSGHTQKKVSSNYIYVEFNYTDERDLADRYFFIFNFVKAILCYS